MALSCICQKAKTNVVLVVCCSQRPKLRWLPHTDKGNPQIQAPFGARQVHTEDNYNHKSRHYAFISSKTMHPQPCLHDDLHGHRKHSQASHKKPLHKIVYPSYSSVGTRMPARNPEPLDLASIPKHARYIKKLPQRNPTLSSPKVRHRRTPARPRNVPNLRPLARARASLTARSSACNSLWRED
jgi:hypothetical protein